jgi:hypothetical protein
MNELGLGGRFAIAGFAVLAMGACEYLPEVSLPSLGPAPLCSGNGLRVETDFPGAGRHDCIIAPDGSIVVSVDHEPTFVEGINPSPWFAFKVTGESPREATITLDYTDYNHRYAPWIKREGAAWEKLNEASLTLNERKTRAILEVPVTAGGTYVAGQPISSAADNVGWTRNALAGRGFSETKYGTSREGRELIGFVGGGGIDVIVALTRQHPPETSGQEAWRGFVERLMTRNDAKANAFRSRHRIILAPMPNPDGVDGGNWRLNDGGVDLNRDWGQFTQPETKALADWIVQQAGDRRVVSMMDFHSTDRTVIYAPPLESASSTINFLPALKQAFDTRLKTPPEWSYSHNASGGTSKGWALEKLKAPGLTVELWDQISAEDARALGATAADALIDYFAK